MRVLIADDAQPKIGKLVTHLMKECELSRDQILIAQSAVDARRTLEREQVDLLILDVVLPLRPEDAAKTETSIELLKELAATDLYKRPRYILGLTAYPEAAAAANQHFKDYLWSLLEYDESSNEWFRPIRNALDYMRGAVAGLPERKADVCVVTALSDPEMKAVRKLPWKWGAETPLDDTIFVKPCTLEVNGKTYVLITAIPSRMGMMATGLLASKLIASYRPSVLAMAGICAGVKGKTNIGDVIFADPTWDWQSGKRVRDNENTQFTISPHQLPAQTSARVRAQQLMNDSQLWNRIRTNWPTPPVHELRFRVGPLASGSAVLADGQVIAEIKAQERNLLGIEMEAYGLFAAAAAAASPRPMPIALKAVCDFADPDKNDEMQAYAAYTSANALYAFLERYLPDLISSVDR